MSIRSFYRFIRLKVEDQPTIIMKKLDEKASCEIILWRGLLAFRRAFVLYLLGKGRQVRPAFRSGSLLVVPLNLYFSLREEETVIQESLTLIRPNLSPRLF